PHFSHPFIDNHFDVLPFHIQDLIKLYAANYFLVFAFIMCKVSQNITTCSFHHPLRIISLPAYHQPAPSTSSTKNRYPYQGYLPKLTSLYSLILFQSESVLLQSQLCPLP